MEFKEKVVLITGGSSGIGMVTALLFAQKGANVAITYKSNKKGADEVVNEIKKLGVKVLAIKADLTKDDEAKKVVDKTIEVFGKIDVLVNNAGRYIDGDEWNLDVDIWIESLKQNLVSAMSMSKYATEVFLKQKSGIIVNVSSIHGVNGHADAISYSAGKAGVINITQSYAELLSVFDGRANVVSPAQTDAGYWLTAPQEELKAVLASRKDGKLIDPKEVAEKIVFLASDESKDINGENFIIN
ncbi:MAG: SDR family oxidoreductase [Candidatus Buchananbacteria bacterium]